MTKMLATPILGENPSKCFLEDQRTNDLVAWNGTFGPLVQSSLFVQNMTIGCPLPILYHCIQLFFHMGVCPFKALKVF